MEKITSDKVKYIIKSFAPAQRRGTAKYGSLEKKMKKELSEKLKNVSPSMTLELSALAKKLKSQGKDIVSFGIGEPDFAVEGIIKAAVIDAVNRDMSHYTDTKGITELREMIADRLKKENGITVSAEQVITCCGAKQAISTALTAICSPGDEVIIPAPYWVSYSEMVKIVGAVPVIVPTKWENGFLMRAEELKSAVTERTKALLLNTPSNPTGNLYPEEELRAIASECLQEGIYIICDEIYDKFLYDGAKHFSIASISDEVADITVTVNGFSKTYAMPGYRLGYAAANTEIIKAMSTIQGQIIGHPASIVQYAGVEALMCDQGFIERNLEEYDGRRKLMMGWLDRCGIEYVRPKGAFYIFADISEFTSQDPFAGSMEFSMALLEKKGVSVVPGIGFGTEGFLRLSYACSREDIEKGMQRLYEFVTEIRNG